MSMKKEVIIRKRHYVIAVRTTIKTIEQTYIYVRVLLPWAEVSIDRLWLVVFFKNIRKLNAITTSHNVIGMLG